jgi:glycosyltransferase involved in cell wall biosynthesis
MLIYNYISFLKVIKIIEKVRPNIIHTNVGPVHIGSFAARLKKIPHIWHIREFQDLHYGWIPFPTKKFLTKELNHPNNFKIAISNAIFNHVYLNKKTRVLYDGVFSISNIPEINKMKKKYFLFVGFLVDAKGVTEAIEAFIEISSKYNDYQLLIAGSGNVSYVKMLQFKADKAMISERVVFLGFRNDVYKLMAEASAILVCSRFEGFGFITAEAMFNGCLVIGKDTGGTKEQFDNGLEMWKQEIGIRYTENKELVLAIEQICKNGIEPYLDTINKAQKTVVEMYSLERNTQKLIDVYHEILK